MNSNTRLIINTLAQNFRTLLNIFLSLYSTRIVLDALGKTDYGIYMLVAGIVSLLSYLTNALVGTTQRHLSYAHGQNDTADAKRIFANSYLLQWGFGAILAIIALLLTTVIFDSSLLNIPIERVIEAKYVYVAIIASVLLTFVASSFRALLIAYENIVYISIVDVLDGILKLALVFGLYFVEDYKLTLYAIIIASVQLFNMIMLAGYCKLHYSETIVIPRPQLFSSYTMRRIVGFAVWKLYETMSIVLRSQGVAIVLNRRFGAVINSSFGIASQVYGSVQFFSEAILNAMRPQIIQAEGKGDRQQMLHLAECVCRYCFFMLSLISIPIIFEIPGILNLWLADVPENTVLFCRVLMTAALLDQLTIGLGVANNAMGHIRNYTLIVFTLKASTVVFIAVFFLLGYGIKTAMLAYIVLELTSAIARLPLLTSTTELTVRHYTEKVIAKLLLTVTSISLTAYLCCLLPSLAFRFIITGIACVTIGCMTFWLTGTSQSERNYVVNIIKNKLKR